MSYDGKILKLKEADVAITGKAAEAFVATFLERYLAHGFGAMQKREIDVLLFHLLSDADQIKDKTNYEVANFLRITEARVKTLRLESTLKYRPANHKEVLGKIVKELIDEMRKPDFDGEYISMALEDPVHKREFEYAAKKSGYQVEYGINRELLKIKPLSLLTIILENIEDGEKEFVKIIKTHITDKEKQATVLDKALSFPQKINKIREVFADNSGLVSLLTAAAGLLL